MKTRKKIEPKKKPDNFIFIKNFKNSTNLAQKRCIIKIAVRAKRVTDILYNWLKGSCRQEKQPFEQSEKLK